MFQINPNEKFLIARQLEDIFDETTYYVKAVIRNSNGEIIKEIELEDKGNKLFMAEWIPPQDVTGNGYYITISTYVYVDNNYTELSSNYGVRSDTYFVQKRLDFNTMLTLPIGGTNISYNKIKEIIENVVDERIKNFSKEDENVKKLIKEISDLFIKTDKIDKKLENYVNSLIKDFEKKISNLKNEFEILNFTIKEIKKDNIYEYYNSISKLEKSISLLKDELNTINNTLIKLEKVNFLKEKEVGELAQNLNSAIDKFIALNENLISKNELENALEQINNAISKIKLNNKGEVGILKKFNIEL